MKKLFAISLATAAFALASGAAHASSNVYWSVGISAPPIGTVISNAPVYSAPAPAYYPEPVYTAPPVVYRPAPVVVAPAPVVYGYGWERAGYVYPREWHRWNYQQRRHWEERQRWERHDHHDEYGDRHGDGRWAPVPAEPRRYRHDQ
ncbi:MAG TPA: hypothetical protein VJ598_12965 [Albitalea sp.]|nr:hypothetical protein [Albitalea sp.]